MTIGVFNANVLYATTENLDVSVNSICLEADSTGALIIDGVAVVAGDIILVKDQTDLSQNGVYDVIEPGDGSTEFKLKRNIIYLNLQDSSNVFVKLGSMNENTFWVLCFDENPFTWGVSSAMFQNVGGGGGGITATPPSTDNAIVRWDGTTGTIIQNSMAFVDDDGNITGENIHRGLSNPNLGLLGEDEGDIYQRNSVSRPGIYVNNGSDRWLKLNSMSPIIFNPPDLVSTSNPPSIITRNDHSALRFPNPSVVASTQKTAIFQSVIPRNYSYQDIDIRIYFTTLLATTGTIGFNLQFERIYPGNSSTTVMNAVPVNVDTNLPIGTLIPEPDGSTTVGVISGDGDGYFTGNGTIPFDLDALTPSPSPGDILLYQTSFSRTLRMNHVEPGDGFRVRLQRKNSGDTVADDVDVFMIQLIERDP